MNNWQDDKRWSDRFLPEIKQILGLHLIGEPPIEEDSERNTDLMVLKLDSVRIACRIRKNKFLDRYGNQFTIRAGRPSGIKTELTKIIEGWGDYFFYGFSDKEETVLEKWILGDLKALRLFIMRELAASRNPWIENKNNKDNSSSFVAFTYDTIPFFIIASDNLK